MTYSQDTTDNAEDSFKNLDMASQSYKEQYDLLKTEFPLEYISSIEKHDPEKNKPGAVIFSGGSRYIGKDIGKRGEKIPRTAYIKDGKICLPVRDSKIHDEKSEDFIDLPSLVRPFFDDSEEYKQRKRGNWRVTKKSIETRFAEMYDDTDYYDKLLNAFAFKRIVEARASEKKNKLLTPPIPISEILATPEPTPPSQTLPSVAEQIHPTEKEVEELEAKEVEEEAEKPGEERGVFGRFKDWLKEEDEEECSHRPCLALGLAGIILSTALTAYATYLFMKKDDDDDPQQTFDIDDYNNAITDKSPIPVNATWQAIIAQVTGDVLSIDSELEYNTNNATVNITTPDGAVDYKTLNETVSYVYLFEKRAELLEHYLLHSDPGDIGITRLEALTELVRGGTTDTDPFNLTINNYLANLTGLSNGTLLRYDPETGEILSGDTPLEEIPDNFEDLNNTLYDLFVNRDKHKLIENLGNQITIKQGEIDGFDNIKGKLLKRIYSLENISAIDADLDIDIYSDNFGADSDLTIPYSKEQTDWAKRDFILLDEILIDEGLDVVVNENPNNYTTINLISSDIEGEMEYKLQFVGDSIKDVSLTEDQFKLLADLIGDGKINDENVVTILNDIHQAIAESYEAQAIYLHKMYMNSIAFSLNMTLADYGIVSDQDYLEESDNFLNIYVPARIDELSADNKTISFYLTYKQMVDVYGNLSEEAKEDLAGGSLLGLLGKHFDGNISNDELSDNAAIYFDPKFRADPDSEASPIFIYSLKTTGGNTPLRMENLEPETVAEIYQKSR